MLVAGKSPKRQDLNFFTIDPSVSPFWLRWTQDAWITIAGGNGENNGQAWNFKTLIDPRIRSDTSKPNASPQSDAHGVYNFEKSCGDVVMQIPTLDPDDDTVKCRWAIGAAKEEGECYYVCKTFTDNALLDETHCTVTIINPKELNVLQTNSPYAIAVQIEDYPKTSITVGGTSFSTTNRLSSIPLQFLVQITPASDSGCTLPELAYPPTPAQHENINVIIKDGTQQTVVVIQAFHADPTVTITQIEGMNKVCVFNFKKARIKSTNLILIIINQAGGQCKLCTVLL